MKTTSRMISLGVVAAIGLSLATAPALAQSAGKLQIKPQTASTGQLTLERGPLGKSTTTQAEREALVRQLRQVSAELKALARQNRRVPEHLRHKERAAAHRASIKTIETVAQNFDRRIVEMERELATVGDDASLRNLELQAWMQQQTQMLQMISNLSKMMHDSAMSIIRNLR